MDDTQGIYSLPTPQFEEPDRIERLIEVSTALEPIYRHYAGRAHAPGVAYGVIADGELIFTHSFGVANTEAQTPVDADTVFRIASMTKSFTALALVKLRDEGRLNFDLPVANYVPELANLRYPTRDAPPITVRHLLTMSAGWPQDDPWADRQLYRDDGSVSEIYRAGIPFSNPPGVTFEYSNTGYMLLGRVISQAAGMQAIRYIVQEILLPLAMTSTVWNASDVAAERLAHGYRWQDEAWLEEPFLATGGDGGTFGSLYSTVRDLARWVALFLDAWPARDEPDEGIVRRASRREMQQPWRNGGLSVASRSIDAPPGVQGRAYGYGLATLHNGKWLSVGHGGGLPGFGTHMRWAPDFDIGVVALANVTYVNMHQASVEALETLIMAAQMPRRVSRPAQVVQTARAGIIRLLEAWDESLADELFADNFFLDLERERWRRQFAHLRATHGSLQPAGPLTVENWLRGRWRMTGERGWCSVWLSLSPTQPPRIQSLQIDSTLPPSPAMHAVAERLAALCARPTRRELSRLFTSTAEQTVLWDRIQLVHILCGPCTVEEVVAGNGEEEATLRFTGPKGSVNATLTLAKNEQKLLAAEFRWPNPNELR